MLPFDAFFGETNLVKVSSNAPKEGAKVMVEKTTRYRDGRLLGEKGEDVVINPRGGRKLREDIAGKRTQDAIDMAKLRQDEVDGRISNFPGLRRTDGRSERGLGGWKEHIGEGRILLFKIVIWGDVGGEYVSATVQSFIDSGRKEVVAILLMAERNIKAGRVVSYGNLRWDVWYTRDGRGGRENDARENRLFNSWLDTSRGHMMWIFIVESALRFFSHPHVNLLVWLCPPMPPLWMRSSLDSRQQDGCRRVTFLRGYSSLSPQRPRRVHTWTLDNRAAVGGGQFFQDTRQPGPTRTPSKVPAMNAFIFEL
jgi:hypothetical protein